MKTLRNTVYTLSLTLLFGCGIDNQKNMHSEDSIQAGNVKPTRKELLLDGYIREQADHLYMPVPDDIAKLINMHLKACINREDFYALLQHITGDYTISRSSYKETTDPTIRNNAQWVCEFYDRTWRKNAEAYCKSIGCHKVLKISPTYNSLDFIDVVEWLMQQNSDNNKKLKDKNLDDENLDDEKLDDEKLDDEKVFQKMEKQKEVLQFIQDAVEEYVEIRDRIMHAMEKYDISVIFKKHNEDIATEQSERFENEITKTLRNPIYDLTILELPQYRSAHLTTNNKNDIEYLVLINIINESKHSADYKLIKWLFKKYRQEVNKIASQKNSHIKLIEVLRSKITQFLLENEQGLTKEDKEKFLKAVDELEKDIELYRAIKMKFSRKYMHSFFNNTLVKNFIEKIKSTIPEERRNLYDYVVLQRRFYKSSDPSSNEQNTYPNILCANLLAAYNSIQNQQTTDSKNE